MGVLHGKQTHQFASQNDCLFQTHRPKTSAHSRGSGVHEGLHFLLGMHTSKSRRGSARGVLTLMEFLSSSPWGRQPDQVCFAHSNDRSRGRQDQCGNCISNLMSHQLAPQGQGQSHSQFQSHGVERQSALRSGGQKLPFSTLTNSPPIESLGSPN